MRLEKSYTDPVRQVSQKSHFHQWQNILLMYRDVRRNCFSQKKL